MLSNTVMNCGRHKGYALFDIRGYAKKYRHDQEIPPSTTADQPVQKLFQLGYCYFTNENMCFIQ